MNFGKPLLAVILIMTSLVACQKNIPLGSKDNPVKLYFTPSVDAQAISTNSRDFINYLEKETGLYFKSGIPASYIAVVEAFGSARADIAVMNSFGYLLANQRYGAQAKLTATRFGMKTYQGAIYASVKSGIQKIEDINGKSFAYTDASSTSGYILPLKLLQEKSIVPKSAVFAIKHDNVITMIYQGQVDAGAAYYSPPAPDGKIRDARDRVRTQFPDIEEKVRIIATTDPIPNDPVVFRKDLPQDVVDKFIGALTKYLATEQGRKAFANIYGFDAVVPATDADYDVLRDAIKKANVDAAKLIEKK